MYTIKMTDKKELVTTVRTNLYQREKLADKFRFLIPMIYDELNLSTFTATLKYIDQGNVAHSEILELSEELYNDSYLIYYLPIDTDLTKFAGDITLRITFSKINLEEDIQKVLHTGETTITILPLKDIYAFVADESLELIDQKMLELEAKMQAADKIAETYNSTKADNITYKDNYIQLESNGDKIGDAIYINSTNNSDETGVPVVSFDEESNDSITETLNVVEF